MASNIESVDNEADTKCNNQIPLKSSKKLYRDNRTADVYFVFKSDDDSVDGSPIRIPAHKNILAAASDVFDAMFYGDLKEKGDVTVVDASAACFEEFLQLFYVTHVKLTVENVADVMKLADKYNVPECLEICVNSLKSSLTIENVCIGLDLAIHYEHNELKQCCERLIALHTENILKSTSFLNCDKRVLEHILKMDILSCSETEVFEGCVAWVKVNSEQDELTKEIVKAHLGDSFYEIRVASMSMKDFAALTSSYGSLFSIDEYKDFIQMIGLPEYQPKLFNRSLRQAHWNTDAVIKCDRIETDTTLGLFIKSSETTIFSTNKPLLLGSFICAEISVYRDKGHQDLKSNLPVEVTISEVSLLSDDAEGSSRILSILTASLPSKTKHTISLPKPVLIRPGLFYKIRSTLLHEQHCFAFAKLKSEVEIGHNTTIKFHNDRIYNSYPVGLIIALNVHRLPFDDE